MGTSSAWEDRHVDLPGRGRVSIRRVEGPAGAPTLVLLHGLAATGRLNWFTALPSLAEHFNLVVLDHRGHGQGIRTTKFRLADCADDAVALADKLDIEKFIPVGYSMGGPIAKLCWQRHPGRVRGLVLCATANHFMTPSRKPLTTALFPGAILAARLTPSATQQRMIQRILGNMPAGDRRERVRRELGGSDLVSVVQAARALTRFSSHEWAPKVSVPTAVLIMTKDRVVPVKRQYRLAASIPGSKIYEIDADHMACVNAVPRFVPTLLEACEWVHQQAAPISPLRDA